MRGPATRAAGDHGGESELPSQTTDGLQQRLLSSIEAFARSLKRHRETVKRQWAKGRVAAADAAGDGDTEAKLFATAPDADRTR